MESKGRTSSVFIEMGGIYGEALGPSKSTRSGQALANEKVERENRVDNDDGDDKTGSTS